MLRLGWQFTVRSGREGVTRLIVTGAAVAVGVAIMLSVLADFHAFQVTSNRPCWECTQGTAVSAAPAPDRRAELWNFGDDIFRGQTIERLEVAALGPGAPAPPGVSRLPAAGQFYASPALAALIRSTPRDQLADRFAGRLSGVIGQAALTGPDELVAYVGEPASVLASVPTTIEVHSIAAAPARQVWSPYFRDAFVVGAVALLFPILILIGTATRLAAARREERFAALRLVGGTSGQIGVVAAVDAAISGLFGAVIGLGLFELIRPALAHSTLTSAHYFGSEVTPPAWGYVAVLAGVPAAAAIAAVLSLRRVRISPLGVVRKVTPAAPSVWRLVPLLTGLASFAVGMVLSSSRSIGAAAYPGLLLIMVGLLVAGPWLTARAARLAPRLLPGAAPLLAGRRLADNPKGAFRSIRGLVLAVFLGTVLAGLLPAANATTATPSARSLSNVLMAQFLTAPVCGDSVNCTGSSPGDTLHSKSAAERRIVADGLPPQPGAALLRGLDQFRGARVYPVYSLPSTGQPGRGGAPGAYTGIVSCASVRQLAVLGSCPAGAGAIQANTWNLYGDNPSDTTQSIFSPANPAVRPDFSGLYLQSVLVRVNDGATLERVRTYLATHSRLSASGTAPRTFGEAVQARVGVGDAVQRLMDIAVDLTLLVAACSLAVAIGGGLVERKRPFTLLRVSGAPGPTLYRVVLLEAAFPLIAATVVAAATAYGISVLTISRLASKGTPLPVLGASYYLSVGAGLLVSVAVLLAAMPLLRRMTAPANARFE
jgi:hypothetical protein